MAKPACVLKGALLGRVAGGDVHNNSDKDAGVAAGSNGRVLRQRASVPGEYIAEPMSQDAKRCPLGNTTLLSELCTWRAVWSVTAAAKVSPELARRGGNKRVKHYTVNSAHLVCGVERYSARCPRLRGHYACHAETTMAR
jgi:hypothetical protein